MRKWSVLFSFELILFLACIGCKGKIDTVEVHDTTRIHDTAWVNDGPAYIRFISMLPSNSIVRLDKGNSFFASASANISGTYIPIRPDTSLTLTASFRQDNVDYQSTVVIPKLYAHAAITYALFQADSAGKLVLDAVPSRDDSARKSVCPPDMCFARFINGVADFPTSGPAVNLYLNSSPTKLFPVAVQNNEITNYVLIPAGLAHVHLRADGDATDAYQMDFVFESERFYTIAYQGAKARANEKASVYLE